LGFGFGLGLGLGFANCHLPIAKCLPTCQLLLVCR
jgi:hypothetical protein